MGQDEEQKERERARKADYRRRKKLEAAGETAKLEGEEPLPPKGAQVSGPTQTSAPEALGVNESQAPARNEPLPGQVVVSRMYGKREDEPHTHVPDEDLTPQMEREIRDFYGYAPSETRTRAQRRGTAERITERKTVTAELAQDAYTLGLAGEPCPTDAPTAFQVAWAQGVWQRQAQMMPEPRGPDMTQKPQLQKALDRQSKGKNPWGD